MYHSDVPSLHHHKGYIKFVHGVIWQTGRDRLKPEAMVSHLNSTHDKLCNLGKHVLYWELNTSSREFKSLLVKYDATYECT